MQKISKLYAKQMNWKIKKKKTRKQKQNKYINKSIYK